MTLVLLIIISLSLAMNMGVSGLSVSFSPSYGSNILSRWKSVVLFTLFVLIGAYLVGDRVASTLSRGIINPNRVNPEVALTILAGITISLLLANLLKIPQSTSIITVSAIVAAGVYFKAVNIHTVVKLILIWIAVSIFSYFFTFYLGKIFYPPRSGNFWVYEKMFAQKSKLKILIIASNCYSAFSIGANNVANVVGPLAGAGVIDPVVGLIAFSPLFGLGAGLFGKGVMETTGKEIIPLGLFSAMLVSFVVSTFILICSLLGLPAPYVQFSTMALMAMHTIKEEVNHSITFFKPLSLKIIKVWTLTPLLSFVVTLLLLYAFNMLN